ncbi:hypothetical protein HCG49_15230 [Arenibacter sp. 6A1]|uniref:hypothetical protein n=1 Tax=Arenibacter sp. 6A1 TaxID=2720391 RepID=UPI001447394C|nr:hypothetical protein [Arenibacter sp. 6A1]NKI27914.1 hypothetical protein [Arenibacter sp. 6A1]
MTTYHNILKKLNAFTTKYYTKILVKGGLLFIAFGVLFMLVILGVEYFLWLGSTGRLLLLLIFLGVEGFLLFKLVLTPLFYLFKIKRGLSDKEASLLIGKHFPEVDDKLYNLLDLAENTEQSDLLLASIEQRANNLAPIPFSKAIQIKDSFKNAKYLLVPFVLLLLMWVSGDIVSYFDSYKRVVNYDMAYAPPAPFEFRLLSDSLEVYETKEYILSVTTVGNIKPENVSLVMGNREVVLQKEKDVFKYVMTPPFESLDFYFKANGIKSQEYQLKVLKVPSIEDFRMVLQYPRYLEKRNDTLLSTGNATFPEGTEVKWAIRGENTERINLRTADSTVAFNKNGKVFSYAKKVYSDMDYEVVTSNENVRYYESLGFRFSVLKDAFPRIKVKEVLDSLQPNIRYYIGESTDDYKISSLSLVCYPDTNKDAQQRLELGKPNKNYEQFYYTFPAGLSLKEGELYSFYFEVKDNDQLHGGKTAKSQVFRMKVLDSSELQNRALAVRQDIIDKMDHTLDNFKQQDAALKEMEKEQKEKSQLGFNDKNKVRDFLRKQEEQENLMQKFSKELKDNLEKAGRDAKLNKLLQERLERQEKEAQKNEKLLEELKKIADKISKEELTQRLEELGKKQKNRERNLEQLLELTKRYYVSEKALQISKDLEKLAEEQQLLSEKTLFEKLRDERQKRLNEKFDALSKEMEELKKDNQSLQKPMPLGFEKEKEEGVKKDMKEALDELEKLGDKAPDSSPDATNSSADKITKKQQSAAQKMKEMSKGMQESASGSGGETLAEDAEMLRQILDNLITFSFKQELLYNGLGRSDRESSFFMGKLKEQQELRELFVHVDDSLFALSLRQAEIAEFVNEQITEVYYNTDRALESMADSQMFEGGSFQKYVLNAANSLSDFLANMLDNMQDNLKAGSGKGQGAGDMQLPDIIKSQEELKEKMSQMGQGSNPKPGGNGTQGKGESEKEGGSGENGKGNNDGKEGQEKGKNGKNGKPPGGAGTGEMGDEQLGELYEIYKEQQRIREAFEKQLKDLINNDERQLGEKILKQMEDFQNSLLENGLTPKTMNKMGQLNYELLKMENAAQRQGQKKERESTTNTKSFQNPLLTKPSFLENYRQEIEILNRQALPLQQHFQNKVKEYFKTDD